MSRYYVTVREVAHYGVWVEADTEAEARAAGEEMVADAITITGNDGVELQGVDDRAVVRVETEAEYAR